MTNKVIGGIVLLGLIIGAGFYVRSYIGGSSQGAGAAGAGAIQIGVAATLSGDTAAIGEGERNAYQMVFDALNASGGIGGRQVRLVIEDTKGTNAGTVDAVQKSVNVDHVQLILGPTWGDSFQGAYPITTAHHVVTLSPSAAIETIENKKDIPYLFSTWLPETPEIVRLQKYLTDHQLTRLAILNDNDAYNTEIAKLFLNVLPSNIQLVGHDEVPMGTTDFRTSILKLKTQNPQAVLVLITNIDRIGPFAAQAKQLGLKSIVVTSAGNVSEENIAKFPGTFEGVTFAWPKFAQDDAYKAVMDAYAKRFGGKPQSPSFIYAYNAARAAVEVLKTGATTGDEIKAGLEKVSIPGIGMGTISFNENGQLSDTPFEIDQIRNDKFVVVED